MQDVLRRAGRVVRVVQGAQQRRGASPSPLQALGTSGKTQAGETGHCGLHGDPDKDPAAPERRARAEDRGAARDRLWWYLYLVL